MTAVHPPTSPGRGASSSWGVGEPEPDHVVQITKTVDLQRLLHAGREVLEEEVCEEVAGSLLVLLEHHEFVEVDVGARIGSQLKADHRAIRHLSAEVALLLDRGDLDGEPPEREDASDQELGEVGLELTGDTAPLVEDQPDSATRQGLGQLAEGSCDVAEVDAETLGTTTDLSK
ncbi:MAG TPA: hypothetical protein VJT31_26315 [Rugosimonospora sp.]|nr:hypothetical protein [Rugosimonospora sp.]